MNDLETSSVWGLVIYGMVNWNTVESPLPPAPFWKPLLMIIVLLLEKMLQTAIFEGKFFQSLHKVCDND